LLQFDQKLALLTSLCTATTFLHLQSLQNRASSVTCQLRVLSSARQQLWALSPLCIEPHCVLCIYSFNICRNQNGHFLHLPGVRGDFCMATTVSTQPQQRFDQAGLMVWISKSCWLKTSVEYGGPGRCVDEASSPCQPFKP
jgi:hypothetical protein